MKISYQFFNRGFWMRFGKKQSGFSISWAKPMFSERLGLSKVYRIGMLKLRILD